MTIVFFVTDTFHGYGDFLFGLKCAASLQNRLREIGYKGRVILVTGEVGKYHICKIGGDIEFNIPVYSCDEYRVLRETPGFRLDYFIEGPVVEWQAHFDGPQGISIPNTTPVLIMCEYSMFEECNQEIETLKQNFQLLGHKLVNCLYSGHGENEKGILPCEELLAVADAKEQGNLDVRTRYWEYFPAPIIEKIRGLQSSELYYEKTDLFLEYSSDVGHIGCHAFLRAHQSYMAAINTTKHQDVICVGNDRSKKESSLNLVLDDLKKNFNKIIFVDVLKNIETIFWDDGKPDPRLYRLLYFANVPHSQMIAFFALSDDLVGVTGDQSWVEAFGKLTVYECLPHKKTFAANFVERVFDLTNSKGVMELASLLVSSDLLTPLKQSRLQTLFQDAELRRVLKNASARIAKNFNLIDPIMQILSKELNSDYQAFLSNLREGIFDFTNSEHITKLIFLLDIKRTDVTAPLLRNTLLQANNEPYRAFLETTFSDYVDPILPYEVPDSPNTPPESPLTPFFKIIYLRGVAQKIIDEYQLENEHPSNLEKRKIQISMLKTFLLPLPTNFNSSNVCNEMLRVFSFIKSSCGIRIFSFIKSSHENSSPASTYLGNTIQKELIDFDLDDFSEPFKPLNEFVTYDPLRAHEEFIKYFNQQSSSKKTLSASAQLSSQTEQISVSRKPTDLTPVEIRQYQKIVANSSVSDGKILKINRKESLLPFSILKHPQDLGFYILDHSDGRIIGQGGWARIKRGYYCNENGQINPDPIAIKIEENTTIEKAEKALMELNLFAQTHPIKNKAHLYKQGERQNSIKIYTFLPLLSGIQLDLYLDKHPNLTSAERLEIVLALLRAITEMHERGVVHLDIKPNNMLYDATSKKIYIIDFGCAEQKGTNITFCNPETGNGKFSEEYTPPEFAKEFNGISLAMPAMDIYSTAITIGQIMGIPLEVLIKDKLHVASTKSDIRDIVSFPQDDLYTHKKGIQFLQTFMQSTQYSFDVPGCDAAMQAAIRTILVDMTKPEPVERISSPEAHARFNIVLSSLPQREVINSELNLQPCLVLS